MNARIQQIMRATGCSYGTAYARHRRELEDAGRGFTREPGRPINQRTREIMREKGCTRPEAQVLRRAEEILGVLAERDKVLTPEELKQRQVGSLRTRRRQARLAGDAELTKELTEQIKVLEESGTEPGS